jgi:hypothetical protein
MIWGERLLFVLLTNGGIVDHHCLNFFSLINVPKLSREKKPEHK